MTITVKKPVIIFWLSDLTGRPFIPGLFIMASENQLLSDRFKADTGAYKFRRIQHGYIRNELACVSSDENNKQGYPRRKVGAIGREVGVSSSNAKLRRYNQQQIYATDFCYPVRSRFRWF
jgi:hypothetical protein